MDVNLNTPLGPIRPSPHGSDVDAPARVIAERLVPAPRIDPL